MTRPSAILRMAAVSVSLGAAFSANASLLSIETGVDYVAAANGSTRTAVFSQLGFSGLLNTVIVTQGSVAAGNTVVSTNIASISNFYGFSAGSQTTLNNGTVTAAYPNTPSQDNIDALVNPAAPDLNGFTSGESAPLYGSGAVNGLGGAWGLQVGYNFSGSIVDADNNGSADSVNYNFGILSIYYSSASTDPNNGKEVLRLFATGLNAGGLTGYVDYSHALALGDAFIQNFFVDGVTGESLYSKWLASEPLTFSMSSPTSGLPTNADLWSSSLGPLFAQNLVNGSITIDTGSVVNDVPEPASLLLAGLALAGAGAARRRR